MYGAALRATGIFDALKQSARMLGAVGLDFGRNEFGPKGPLLRNSLFGSADGRKQSPDLRTHSP